MLLARVGGAAEFGGGCDLGGAHRQRCAALGGGDAPLLAKLAAYGSPLGRAFQYRDDILGVFGDERLTGKPTGDDLREGKLTVLVVEAMARASEAAAARLQQLLGTDLDAAGVAEAQSIIVDSGALATTEAEVTRGAEQAWAALVGMGWLVATAWLWISGIALIGLTACGILRFAVFTHADG